MSHVRDFMFIDQVQIIFSSQARPGSGHLIGSSRWPQGRASNGGRVEAWQGEGGGGRGASVSFLSNPATLQVGLLAENLSLVRPNTDTTMVRIS